MSFVHTSIVIFCIALFILVDLVLHKNALNTILNDM